MAMEDFMRLRCSVLVYECLVLMICCIFMILTDLEDVGIFILEREQPVWHRGEVAFQVVSPLQGVLLVATAVWLLRRAPLAPSHVVVYCFANVVRMLGICVVWWWLLERAAWTWLLTLLLLLAAKMFSWLVFRWQKEGRLDPSRIPDSSQGRGFSPPVVLRLEIPQDDIPAVHNGSIPSQHRS